MDPIILEENYPYAIEQVWEALTDPIAVADWLMPGDFKPVVGHKFVFTGCEPRPEFDGKIQVEILDVEKPTRLAYTWKSSDMETPTVVTYVLTSRGTSTHLRLEHAGFDGENGKLTHPLFKNGWPTKLHQLLPQTIAKRNAPGALSRGL
jgi:uncharacterized protein YndB with AHSA1/START domain